MHLIEFPPLAISPPSQIALPCLSEVEMCYLREAARRVETGCQLAGERLVLDETLGARQCDRALVQLHGIKMAPLETSNLCAKHRCTVFKVLRTIHCPGTEQLLVPGNCLAVLGVRLWP